MDFNVDIFFYEPIEDSAEYCLKALKKLDEISSEIILDNDKTLERKTEGIFISEDFTGIDYYADGQQEMLIKKFKEIGDDITNAQEPFFPQINLEIIKQLNSFIEELKDDLYYDSVTLSEMGEIMPEIKDGIFTLLKICFEKDNQKYKQWAENKDLVLHTDNQINYYLNSLKAFR